MDIRKTLQDRTEINDTNVDGSFLLEDTYIAVKRFTYYGREMKDFVNFANRKKDNGILNEGKDKDSSKWRTFTNYNELQDAWKTGWNDGVDMMKEKKMELNLSSSIGRVDQTFDLHGNAFDMGRVVEGHPEAWFRDEIVEDGHGGKIKHIAVHIGALAGVKGESLVRRGVVISSLIDLLEASGYRCEVTAFFGSMQDKGSVYAGFIEVKKAQDPLNYDKIALAFIAPDMFRRWKFSSQHTWLAGKAQKYFDFSGYGRTISSKRMIERFGYDFSQFDLILDNDGQHNENFGSDKKAIKSFKRMAKSQGIDIDLQS